MNLLVRGLRSFGRFWYDFVVGDDPKTAVGVVLALGVALAALAAGAGDTAVALTGGIVVMAAFAVGLAVDIRPRRSGGGRSAGERAAVGRSGDGRSMAGRVRTRFSRGR